MVPEQKEEGSDVEETQVEVKLQFGLKKNGCALADGRVAMVPL